jgi:hypothetical protein
LAFFQSPRAGLSFSLHQWKERVSVQHFFLWKPSEFRDVAGSVVCAVVGRLVLKHAWFSSRNSQENLPRVSGAKTHFRVNAKLPWEPSQVYPLVLHFVHFLKDFQRNVCNMKCNGKFASFRIALSLARALAV